jgi:putative selenium metabolism hydrolase
MSVSALPFRQNIIDFLRDIIRIPSFSGQEELVVKRIMSEMNMLGVYDSVSHDALGNVVGKVGDGPITILFDAHIDVVGIGDPSQWSVDPFAAEITDGFMYGRGSTDEKPAMACMAYAPLLLSEKLRAAVTIYVVGSVMEEDCDGYPLLHLIEKEGVRPDYVVLGEPTGLRLYRGHRGRMEITVSTQGVAAHGAHCDRGVNAIYQMASVISDIQQLHTRLKTDPILGKGSITISKIESNSPSLCSVADSCTIYLDRRCTRSDSKESVLDEISCLPAVQKCNAHVSLRDYTGKSWTGFVAAQEAYFPTWLLDDSHPLVQAGLRAATAVHPATAELGVWQFSTNGVASMGRLGIPTIGYAPGEEELSHSVNERVALDDLTIATEFYATLVDALARVPFGQCESAKV